MDIGITLYICKTKCWKCGKEYNAAYSKWKTDDMTAIVSPDEFKEKEIKIAQDNGANIGTKAYEYSDGRVEIFTSNVCPHCKALFGNNHIKELIGHEVKEIVIREKK